MAQDFIQEEAQKYTSIVDEVKNALLPSGTQYANQIGNLFGATAGTVANFMQLVPGSKILLAVTAANGAMVNYGVQIAKDGEHSYKAVITSASGAVVSTVVADKLGSF